MAEGEIDDLTMEQYLILTRQNHAPGMVKPEIEGNEGDKTLYQAWERYNDLLYKCPTHDINSHQKVNIFYNGLSTMNHQLLDSQGPNPGMTPAQALMAIQTMADHSQKWHDGSSSRSINNNNNNTEGITAIEPILTRSVLRTKKLKALKRLNTESLDVPHLSVMEQKYRVGPPGYYTCIDNRPSFGEKKPSLEEFMNKHLEESTRRRAEMEEWVKKLQENAEINTRNQIYDDKEAPLNNEINEPHEVSFVSDDRTLEIQEEGVSSKILSCQLPPKELNPGNFTLPCTIGSLNFYAIADLVEMADMTKRAPIETVENVFIKIDKFSFPSDFVVIDMLKTRNEIIILGRPFLATIHTEIDVFNKEISLGIRDDRVTFDMNRKVNNFITLIGTIYMINSNRNDEPSSSSDTPTFLHDS
ncbi:reverse transcriptase domain-containing protein [Tanacetum coccineum]